MSMKQSETAIETDAEVENVICTHWNECVSEKDSVGLIQNGRNSSLRY